MNIGEIAERFIRAAEIERAIPEHVGPMPPRSVNLGYVHDWVDKLGWSKQKGDKLLDDPLAEERKRFWDAVRLLPSAREISELEFLRAWLLSVTDEGERRALLAWARSKAGGKTFKHWCFKVENIHPETGRRRKDRALARIYAHLSRSDVQHFDNGPDGVLPEPAENVDIEATFPEPSTSGPRAYTWRDDGAFASFIPGGIAGEFDWARKRNERRRQQEARRRKEAA